MSNITVKTVSVSRSWQHVEFGLFLFGQLMSIPCYLFVIYHLAVKKDARKLLHNHAIVVMLIFNFIHLTIYVSILMNFLMYGYMSFMTPALCLVEQYVDYGIWFGAIFLMVWISIERHILIFHSTLITTTRGRFLFHYLPLTAFTLYAPVLYFYFIFIYPCKPTYDATSDLCGGLCYRRTVPAWYIWYESFVNYTIPILLIAVLGIFLILRVISQKHRSRQAFRWRRYRKMVFQLLLMLSVYLICDLPYIVIIIVRWSGIPTFGSNVLTPYISHLTYVPAIILPYAILLTLPELKQKLHSLMIWKTNRRLVGDTTS